MNNNDLYAILELPYTCNQEDIKKSYKRLVSTYHPDKNIKNKEKFISIQNAYDCLKDPEKKYRYDILNKYQKLEFYNIFQSLIKEKIPDLAHYINSYMDNDVEIKNYINDMNFVSLYEYLIKKVNIFNNNDDLNIHNNDKSYLDDMIEVPNYNIHGKIIATFEERYNDKYKRICVNKQTKEPKIYFIPLRESRIIIKNEGEYNEKTKIHGDIIFDIELDNSTYEHLTQINSDIFCYHYISLYDYLYGGSLKIKFPNNDINLDFDSFVEKIPLITINNMGMPIKDNEFDHQLNVNNNIHYMNYDNKNNSNLQEPPIVRGNLYIYLKIKNLEIIKDKIKTIN